MIVTAPRGEHQHGGQEREKEEGRPRLSEPLVSLGRRGGGPTFSSMTPAAERRPGRERRTRTTGEDVGGGVGKKPRARGHRRGVGGGFCGGREEEATAAGRKRVMVVVDQSSGAKHAMMWALTHVANRGDFLTLLHVLPRGGAGEEASALANSLGSLCKACKPEVEVEALVIQGPMLATVLSQVKKLEASVLVLSQRKPSPFCCFMRSSGEVLVEECINRAECLTLAVRRQSKGVGGYLVSTRWQKNFWLLA